MVTIKVVDKEVVGLEIKLYDSELKVMDALWNNGDLTAGQLAKLLNDEVGWNRNTTYTIIKKCIHKGAIKRLEPNFICHALVTREQMQQHETTEFIDKVFSGSTERFFAAFIESRSFSQDEINKLKKMVQDLK